MTIVFEDTILNILPYGDNQVVVAQNKKHLQYKTYKLKKE